MTFFARAVRSQAGASAAAALLAIVAVTFVVMAAGYDVSRAATALWDGSFGSAYSFFSGTLQRATPLIIVGLAVAVAFRAGVLNIGAEGQLLSGAAATIMAGLAMSGWPAWLSVSLELFAGMAAGAAWAGIAAVLKRRFGVLEVISTLMLNFVALYGVSYLVHGPLQEPTHTYPETSRLAASATLPLVIPGQQLHLGFVLAIALGIAAHWYIRSTAGGFRLRVAGDGPLAAASAGRVKVDAVLFGAFLASGAIAVALLARLSPLGVILAGVFFGALEAGGAGMQRDAGVPAGFVYVIEALVILGVLAVDRARTLAAERAPRVSGESAV